MTKIALTLEPQQIWTTLTQLGFGRVTASEFPGESAGVLSNYSSWRPIGHLVAVARLRPVGDAAAAGAGLRDAWAHSAWRVR